MISEFINWHHVILEEKYSRITKKAKLPYIDCLCMIVSEKV